MVSASTLVTLGLPAPTTVNYVDIAGDLACAVAFASDITVSTPVALAGDLAPSVAFGGDLTVTQPGIVNLAGDLPVQIAFGANITAIVTLSGDLSADIRLTAGLTGVVDVQGSMSFTVDFAASGLMGGPLWVGEAPVPPTMWTPTDPGDTVEWKKSELSNG